MKKLLIFVVFFLILSCSTPKKLLEKAKKEELKKQYEFAEQSYLSLIVKYPKSTYAVEAKYRLGLLYKDIKKDYLQAKVWFEEVIKEYPESEFAKFAEVGILESPEYIGALDGNKIVLGDFESYGKNMRSIFEFKKLDFNLYECRCQLFAGDRLIREEKKYYLKTGKEIREYLSNPKSSKDLRYTVVLKLPIEVGNSWITNKENRIVEYKIVAKNLKVKLRKTEFEECIKILETFKDEVGIRYIYYAPNKGCIKITTASMKNPKQEFSVLELIENF